LTLRTALEQGTRILSDAGLPVPRLTAEVLLAHACRVDRVYLFAHPEQELREVEWLHFGRYLHQRLKGTPTQYITKRQEFYGRDFRVTPDVLIPRPETEHLVAAALDRIQKGARIADIGTGSGAIAITLALEAPNTTVFATDISLAALQTARRNATTHSAPVHFILTDLTEAIAPASLDLLVSNPPYIDPADAPTLAPEVRDHEPHVALFAPESGNAIYRRLIADAARVLKPGGWLCLELGHTSLDPVKNMLPTDNITVIPDLAGIPRVICAKIET